MEPVVTLALLRGLSEFVPTLARWIGGDKAGEVAEKAAEVARQVTGTADPMDALQQIRLDPQLQLQLQQALTPVILAQLDADARQLETVNATLRAEYASQDEYVRRWRPYWGYTTARAWMIQTAVIACAVIGAAVATVKGNAVAVTALLNGAADLIAALTVQWSIALAVLGVSVAKRSQDKQVAAGQVPAPGMLSVLMERLTPGQSTRSRASE